MKVNHFKWKKEWNESTKVRFIALKIEDEADKFQAITREIKITQFQAISRRIRRWNFFWIEMFCYEKCALAPYLPHNFSNFHASFLMRFFFLTFTFSSSPFTPIRHECEITFITLSHTPPSVSQSSNISYIQYASHHRTEL